MNSNGLFNDGDCGCFHLPDSSSALHYALDSDIGLASFNVGLTDIHALKQWKYHFLSRNLLGRTSWLELAMQVCPRGIARMTGTLTYQPCSGVCYIPTVL